jgi:CBS domain-containing protein
MLVHEVMSAPAITVSAQTLTRKALKMLDEYGISAMPVVDADGGIIGVVSEALMVQAIAARGVQSDPGSAPEPDGRTTRGTRWLRFPVVFPEEAAALTSSGPRPTG